MSNKTVIMQLNTSILFLVNIFIQKSNNERFFCAYHIQVTGKDDHVNADHLYETVEADDKESDLESKPCTLCFCLLSLLLGAASFHGLWPSLSPCHC